MTNELNPIYGYGAGRNFRDANDFWGRREHATSAVRRVMLITAANVCGVGLLLGLGLILVSGAEDAWIASKGIRKPYDERADSAAYSDGATARQIFRDQFAGEKEYRPFIEWRQKPIQLPTLTVDANGYRVHSVGAPNTGKTSIGFFGGSTMWGVGASDNETIPAYFDILTNGLKVANYGERGYTSRQASTS